MVDRAPEAETTDIDSGEGATRWDWIAGAAIVVLGAGGTVAAVSLTPGDPFACRLPNPRAWMLCDWSRAFVANLILIALAFTGCCLLLGLLVGVPRAVLRAVRN